MCLQLPTALLVVTVGVKLCVPAGVWCCKYRDVFAVLEEPPPNLPAVGKPKKVKKKDSEKWAAAEAAALAASMAAATLVRIKALDGLGCSTVCHQVRDVGRWTIVT